jgi:hypothetical protein
MHASGRDRRARIAAKCRVWMQLKTISSIAAAGLALGAAGCGDEEPAPGTTVVVEQPPAPGATEPPPVDKPPEPAAEPDPTPSSGPAESPAFDPRANALEREAAAAVRAYVAALDDRDGDAACAVLAPGVVDDVDLPEERAGCAASLAASIGYRDPRGLPVWEGARVADVGSIELGAGGGEAKVVATVVTRFADRDEVSVEDDVIYLVRDGGRWLVAKPSSTLYRAVGIADVPPSVLTPPN